jgi:hypothetical protein
MIQVGKERVFPLSKTPKYLDVERRGGKRLHPSTPFRWAKDGLETIRVGGALYTSLEALQRYFERKTAVKGKTARPQGDGASPSPAAVRANQLLETSGV